MGRAATPVEPDGPAKARGRTPSGDGVDAMEARAASLRNQLAADGEPAAPMARLSEREVERGDGKAAPSAAGMAREVGHGSGAARQAVLEKMEALARRYDAGHGSEPERAEVAAQARALHAAAVEERCFDAASMDDCAALAVLARLASDRAADGHLKKLEGLLAETPDRPGVLLSVAALMDKLAPLWHEPVRGDMYRLMRPAMLAAAAAIAKDDQATAVTADLLRSVYALRQAGLRIVLMSAMREQIGEERFAAALDRVFPRNHGDTAAALEPSEARTADSKGKTGAAS
jgi:hypothetical protein